MIGRKKVYDIGFLFKIVSKKLVNVTCVECSDVKSSNRIKQINIVT